jgi:hypothetical protein
MNIERLDTPWWALGAGYTQLGGDVADGEDARVHAEARGLFGGGAKVTA